MLKAVLIAEQQEVKTEKEKKYNDEQIKSVCFEPGCGIYKIELKGTLLFLHGTLESFLST